MEIYAVNIAGLNEFNFDYETYNQVVSEQTLEKAKNYKHFKDSVRTIIGELLVYYVYHQNHMEKEINIPLVILRNEYGKPYCNEVNFHFNVSHAGSWVVCIVDTKQVGIDIELMTNIDYEALISLFHSFESQQMKATTSKKDYFYNLWTIKESVIKNIGKGLSIPLDSFYVRLNQEVTSIHFEGSKLDDTKFHVQMFEFQENYKLAACALHDKFPDSINLLDATNLFSFLASDGRLLK
ncbi:4'-phosphopantetheinyl transferase superfamily protein [Viridibacillus sp. YIM B01967]|uniref:4'-phosphopantetheinyl transferase superfamily protein n=1 Tax=Viridibacillus soli TaxID=2798301 RepID=A0ABS1H306_9BACL|nr:4'-phosphopantetheinyl transferase superfamily protein [Viridibacillus soli]MBK3493789.1 4'-phosphopantetheinyl transferase superfamily protein [Viridibacillus soli]